MTAQHSDSNSNSNSSGADNITKYRIHNRLFITVSVAVGLMIVGAPAVILWRDMHKAMLRRALFDSIKGQNADEVIRVLREGANPNWRLSSGQPSRGQMGFASNTTSDNDPTPLLASLMVTRVIGSGPGMWSTSSANPNANPRIVQALLEAGADANATDSSRLAPIDLAIQTGNVELVEMLAKHGAPLTGDNSRDNIPLIEAVGADNVKMVQFLLDHGADANTSDKYGTSALLGVVRTAGPHSVEIARLLISRGCRLDSSDGPGRTALFHANHPWRRSTMSQRQVLADLAKVLKAAGAR